MKSRPKGLSFERPVVFCFSTKPYPEGPGGQAQAAACLSAVGTLEIVFSTCEAIW